MDRRIIIFIVVSICYLFYVSPANAVSFTANVTPSEVNASDKDVLVNFTIAHTSTTVNITQVNITLPSGFLYSGVISDDATTSGNATNIDEDTSGGIIKWTNSTKAGFVTGANRFWFEIDTPGSNATFNFNISVRDTNDAITSVNVTFKLLDTIAPQFSSNTTSIATSSKYVRNLTYEFSAAWTDRIAINTTLIEHNFTGTSANYTMFRSSGNTYKYNFTDIAAGLYVWRMFVNDTVNNINKTDQYFYNITPADNPLEIFFDGNKNQDYQTSNESALNVTTNSSAGTVFIYRNNNLVKSGTTLQTSLDTLLSGTYTYKTNATGNQNYTDNSTGLSFTVTLTSHAPKWSGNTTSFPSSYSNTTVSTFEVTWKDNTDANAFSVAIIEINQTGSFINHTMYRVPGTNRSQFNGTIPAGIIRWKVYANNSNNVFNTTSLFSSELTQAKPKLTLSSSLGWEVDIGGETNVTCSADTGQVTPKLFREGASVSIPDKTSLTVGKYVYKCNNTATQNYSSNSESQTLEIKSFTKYLSIVNITSALKIIEITENSTIFIEVQATNRGNLSDTISFSIEGLNSSWYAINSTTASLAARGGRAGFGITFSVGSVEIRDYLGSFKMVGKEETIYSNFTLRVLPGQQTKTKINDTLETYKSEFVKFGVELNVSKLKNMDVSSIEGKYSELKLKLDEAEKLIAQGDYFGAFKLLDEFKSLLDSTKEEFSKAQIIEQGGNITGGELVKSTLDLLPYILAVVGVIVVGVVAYLFWPTKEKTVTQKPEAKKPESSAKTPSQPAKKAEAEGSDVWNKMKSKLNEIVKRKEKEFKYKYEGA